VNHPDVARKIATGGMLEKPVVKGSEAVQNVSLAIRIGSPGDTGWIAYRLLFTRHAR
jgi:hypothetical protein